MASQHREDDVLIEIHEHTKLYTFHFLKDMICSVSPFFQKAFEGCFLESKTGVIDISDVAVENFRIFAKWVTTGQLEQQPLEIMLELYVMADRLDIPTFRNAIIVKLTSDHCFKFDFEVPDTLLIIFMMEIIPKSSPIHALLATAVARVLYHNPEGLEYLPHGFAVRVQSYLDQPYGICDACFDHDQDHDHDGETHNIADNCEHFFNQPSVSIHTAIRRDSRFWSVVRSAQPTWNTRLSRRQARLQQPYNIQHSNPMVTTVELFSSAARSVL